MNENHDIANEINLSHQFLIQLDRRNGKDFKCYSVGTDIFRAYVRQTTGYSEPDRSSYTDIVTLCRDICGVNLSIGYRNEHSADEHLVVEEWVNTLNICRKWLSEQTTPNNRINSDWQFRCAPLPAGYAERSANKEEGAMHFTQKILLVLILTLVLFYIIAGSLSAIGHPLGDGAVTNILSISLLIVFAWLVFGPLSRLIGQPPRGRGVTP